MLICHLNIIYDNPEWVWKFKKLFYYDKLEKKLELSNSKYNYNNLDSNIDSIIDNVYEEDIIMKDKNFPEINLIMTSLSETENIYYTNPGIIIHSKIMDIIKSLNGDIKKFFHSKIFFFQSNLVYLY